MKTIVTTLVILAALTQGAAAQNLNWKSLDAGQRNVVQLQFGYDFGVTAQAGYGHVFDIIRPVLIGFDYSIPMGNDLTDDFKIRLGAQIEMIEWGDLVVTLKILSNFRRFHNELVTISSFGSDFSAVAGYYRPTWYAAGEAGFDKSITSYLKHSDIMKQYVYADVQDGWYLPSGGNFYFGVLGGKTLGENLELSLRLGITRAQKRDENAILPYYAQLGLGVRF